jgi:hypothetical protein
MTSRVMTLDAMHEFEIKSREISRRAQPAKIRGNVFVSRDLLNDRQMRRVRPTPAHNLRTGLPEPSANDNRGGRFVQFMRMLASV